MWQGLALQDRFQCLVVLDYHHPLPCSSTSVAIDNGSAFGRKTGTATSSQHARGIWIIQTEARIFVSKGLRSRRRPPRSLRASARCYLPIVPTRLFLHETSEVSTATGQEKQRKDMFFQCPAFERNEKPPRYSVFTLK